MGTYIYGQGLFDPLRCLLDIGQVDRVWIVTLAIFVFILFVLTGLSCGRNYLFKAANFHKILICGFSSILLVSGIQVAAMHYTEKCSGGIANYLESKPTEQNWGKLAAPIGKVLITAKGSMKTKVVLVSLGVVAAVAFFFLGGGYCIVAMSSSGFAVSLPMLFFAYIVGVGYCEELSKTIVGLCLAAWIQSSRPKIENEAMVYTMLGCQFIAHLSFGAVEALYYFVIYHTGEMNSLPYLIRIFWCIPLHVAWGVLSAIMIIWLKVTERQNPLLYLFWSITPAAILHGSYDALSGDYPLLAWMVGGGSILTILPTLNSYFRFRAAKRL